MEKVVKKIEVEVVTQVKSKCPISHWFTSGSGPRYLKRCKDCEFYSGNGGHHCEWYEYRTEFITKSSEHEDGLLSSYYWTIKCLNCGTKIHLSSGMSSLLAGDKKRCANCKLLHTFLDSEKKSDGGWIHVFIVPVKAFDDLNIGKKEVMC